MAPFAFVLTYVWRKSAPSAFQKLASDILKGCCGTLCYLDTVVVFGSNSEEHAQNFHCASSRLSDAGLKLNAKCAFRVQELPFVGHVMSKCEGELRRPPLRLISRHFGSFWGWLDFPPSFYTTIQRWHHCMACCMGANFSWE